MRMISSLRVRTGLAATAVFCGATLLYMHRIAGPLRNGDEVIYAQTAYEMAEAGDWLVPRWQGQPLLTRPPASLWALAASIRLFGASELAIRGVVALEAALAVALLFLLAARRHGLSAGLFAAALLATADRYFVYARYVESEPLLVLFVIGAVFFWEEGRDRALARIGWGVCLAGALMTKQVIGAFPLLLPLLDWVTRAPPSGSYGRRAIAIALGVAAALTLPWHLYAWIKFGGAFVDTFWLANVVRRTTVAMHQSTGPLFYLEMMWRHDKALLLLGTAGFVYAAAKRDFLPLGWAAAALIPYSLVASRYDYYALLAYPAFALAAGGAVAGVTARLMSSYAFALWSIPIVVNLHLLWPRIGEPTPGDEQIRHLAGIARAVSRPTDVLLLIEEYPFTAKFYSQLQTIEVLLREKLDPGSYEANFAAQGDFVATKDVAGFVARYPRWFAIARKGDVKRLRALSRVYLVEQSRNYLLFTNLERP